MSDLVARGAMPASRLAVQGKRCRSDHGDGRTYKAGAGRKAGKSADHGCPPPAAADLALILSGKDEQILRELDPKAGGPPSRLARRPSCRARSGLPARSRPRTLLRPVKRYPSVSTSTRRKPGCAARGSEDQLALLRTAVGREVLAVADTRGDKTRHPARRELGATASPVAREQGGVITSYTEARRVVTSIWPRSAIPNCST